MSTDTSQDSGTRWRGWRFHLALGLTILVVVWAVGRTLLSGIPGAIWPRSRMTLRAAQPTLVREIRAMARLETAASTMQQVVEGERSVPPLPAWLVGDRILFVAQGEAIAGVDLTEFRPDDVRAVADRVHVRLPEPTIFTVHLDEANCRVYDRTVGWLTRPDPLLESRVRQQACERLTEAARDRGLLLAARENAEKTIASLLRTMGAREVIFD